jgi:hypothetical protein
MSHDISRILDDWDYDPGNLIRIIKADNGRDVMQVRQPLGIEQYELEGRPDGQRPEGKESYLDVFIERLRKYKEEHQGDDGFEIDHENFLRLQSEGIIYYYRYLILFQISDFERTAADTDHNLRLCDLVEKYAAKEKDKKEILQYRPYILRINAISKAMTSLNQQLKTAATEIIESAIDVIKKMPNIDTPAFQFEKIRSINSLRSTLRQIQEQKISPLDKLRAELDDAVEQEDYERAAQLRDRIMDLEGAERLHDDMD